jgi:GxxExxY protein
MSVRDLVHVDSTESIIGTFYDVYNALRFGFLESVYSAAMEDLLRSRGLIVQTQVQVPVFFRGKEIAKQRLDMIVDERVIVEIKSTEVLHQSAHRQLLSYLRSTELEVGLLLHFGPQARFYRAITLNKPREPVDQADPPDPIR